MASREYEFVMLDRLHWNMATHMEEISIDLMRSASQRSPMWEMDLKLHIITLTEEKDDIDEKCVSFIQETAGVD